MLVLTTTTIYIDQPVKKYNVQCQNNNMKLAKLQCTHCCVLLLFVCIVGENSLLESDVYAIHTHTHTHTHSKYDNISIIHSKYFILKSKQQQQV
jgi:hypothetical protein